MDSDRSEQIIKPRRKVIISSDSEIDKSATVLRRGMAMFLDEMGFLSVPLGLIYLDIPSLFKSLAQLFSLIPSQYKFFIIPTIWRLFFAIIYSPLIYFKGCSPGKMIMSIAIVNKDNERMSLLQIFCREFISKLLSFQFFAIGYLIGVFRKDRRALHDYLSNTLVVNSDGYVRGQNDAVYPIKKTVASIFTLLIIFKVESDLRAKFNNNDMELSVLRNQRDLSLMQKKLDAQAMLVNKVKTNEIEHQNQINLGIVIKAQRKLDKYKRGETEDFLSEEELKIKDVQKEVFEKYPGFIWLIPSTVIIEPELLNAFFENQYDATFYLPKHMTSSSLVKELGAKYKERDNLEFEILKNKKLDELASNRGMGYRNSKYLIHPKFLEDIRIVDSFGKSLFSMKCNGLLHSISWELRDGMSDEIIEKFMKSFIQFANEANADCLPRTILKDPVKMLRLVTENPQINMMSYSVLNQKYPDVFNALVEYYIQRYSDNMLINNPLFRSVKAQEIFFKSYPENFKFWDGTNEADETLTYDFLTTRYDPDWYLSAVFKNSKAYKKAKERLAKVDFKSKDKLTVDTSHAVKSFNKIQCCGTSFDTGLNRFVSFTHPDILKSVSFISQINPRSISFYFKHLNSDFQYTDEIKSYLIENAGKIVIFRDDFPHELKNDPEFMKKFEAGRLMRRR